MSTGKLRPTETQTIIYLTVIYVIGMVGMLTKGTLPIFMFLVPVNIVLAAAITLLYHPKPNLKFAISCILIYIGGFVIEWLGVKTGVIFGTYSYETGLGLKLDEVPIIMGLNWLLLVYGATCIAARFLTNKLWIIAVGAVLMLMYDIFLEPSAIHYKFWAWDQNMIPLQNYIAWFVGAFIFISIFILFVKIPPKNKVAEAIFWLQLAFFGVLWLGNN